MKTLFPQAIKVTLSHPEEQIPPPVCKNQRQRLELGNKDFWKVERQIFFSKFSSCSPHHKSHKDLENTSCCAPGPRDKQGSEGAAQALTFTGGVAPVPECRRIWQPFWLGLCCLLLSCGFFTVPPWSFLTDSTFSAVVLLNSLVRDKPITPSGLRSTQNVTEWSGL